MSPAKDNRLSRKARRPGAGAPLSLPGQAARGAAATRPAARPGRASAAPARVGAIDEFELIDRLARLLPPPPRPVPVGLGDDAALVPTGPATLVTTDVQVEGVHFRRDLSLPEEVGRRALEVNLSDVAAMGGVPEWGVISLLLPPDLPLAALEGVYRGLAASARRAGVGLVGGNISRAGGGPFSITVTLLGRPAARRPVRRSGARPGDLVVVTGYPGLAAAGRQLLEESGPGPDLWAPPRPARGRASASARPEYPLADPAARAALGRFLAPEARLNAGPWAARAGASALIDLSDGLAADLGHLLEASGVGARLDRAALPRLRGYDALCATRGWRPEQLILFGGDDYELLLTISPRRWAAAAPRTSSAKIPKTVIGQVTAEPGVLILADGLREAVVSPRGWRHTGG